MALRGLSNTLGYEIILRLPKFTYLVTKGALPMSEDMKSTFQRIPPYEEEDGEEYMNPRQQEHFRCILQQWKDQLLDEMQRTVHHMRDDAVNFPDPNDRASQEEEFTLELRTRDRERKLIKKIEESLQAIDSGDYGYCDSCGVDIGIRRLEARPTATKCIDCKSLDEIREKQMA
jgi:DnaK suppressor protein